MIPCLFVLGSCCWGDDGGYGSGSELKNQTILRMADSTDTLYQISYLEVPTVLKPLNDSSFINLSENTNTTLFISRKNKTDTLTLAYTNKYSYSNGPCSGSNVYRVRSNVPYVVQHTLNKVVIKDTTIYNGYNYLKRLTITLN